MGLSSGIANIAQQKFVTGFGAPAQYFKQLAADIHKPDTYLRPTALGSLAFVIDEAIANPAFG